MTYEVYNDLGYIIAVFPVESWAKEYAESKGYKVRNISPDWAPNCESWHKCNFAGYRQVEIEGVEYRRE